jgi:hypothetical protein
MSAYIKRTERSQINDLMLHLKILEKQEQAKTKRTSREIIKIRAEINEIETKTKMYKESTKTKIWFFEKINNIDRPLANLTKIRREKNPNQKNQKCKRGDNNKQPGNPGNHQRLL